MCARTYVHVYTVLSLKIKCSDFRFYREGNVIKVHLLEEFLCLKTYLQDI